MEAHEPVIVDNTEKCDDETNLTAEQQTALDAALANEMVKDDDSNDDAINDMTSKRDPSVVDDPVSQEDLEEGEIEDDEEEQETSPPPSKDFNSAVSQNDPDGDKSDGSSGGEDRRRSR